MLYKVFEVKNNTEQNDRYYENLEKGIEMFNNRVEEMQSSKYYIHVDEVLKDELVPVRRDTIQKMSYVYSKLSDNSIQMTVVILETVEKRR